MLVIAIFFPGPESHVVLKDSFCQPLSESYCFFVKGFLRLSHTSMIKSAYTECVELYRY